MKQFVIHHSADYDGIFCREIARRFLPGATIVGWDYGDPTPLKGELGGDEELFMLDISIPDLMDHPRLVWIDHHKSAMEKFGDKPGYQIDGVAACRLAWQYFEWRTKGYSSLPGKEDFISRDVSEPMAVRLAGEYDIWDHRGDGDIDFQFGLDAQKEIDWGTLLLPMEDFNAYESVAAILNDGSAAMRCYSKRDGDTMKSRSFMVEWEGLKFLSLTTARCNSNTFAARDVPETGHDALMAFFYNGSSWTVSLYHASHRKDIDLSLIAVKHGGGGHRGACGFRLDKLPFIP